MLTPVPARVGQEVSDERVVRGVGALGSGRFDEAAHHLRNAAMPSGLCLQPAVLRLFEIQLRTPHNAYIYTRAAGAAYGSSDVFTFIVQ